MRSRETFSRATCDMHHALLLLLLAAAGRASPANFTDTVIDDGILVGNDTIIAGNQTFIIGNDTIIEMDGLEPVIRKKRTFGDIVFRGLADVLGYNVARKPTADFPPPLAPVPGIDTPLQAGPAAPAAPPPCGAPRAATPPPCGAPRAAAPPPCGAPRATTPPPCRAPPPPPKPKPPPPCPKPRAAPRPKPRPTPPPAPPSPPPPPPCAKPRANPTTPSPCAPPPPQPKQDPALETISSNFQLNFNINRNRPTQAPAPAADYQDDDFEQQAPIAIEPRAAQLPAPQQRKPRVYVDAFVVRNGITQRVDTVNADQFAPRRGAADDDDFIAYDDDQDASDEDDYEDVQESRDKAVRQFGTAVDAFWGGKAKKKKALPTNHYQNVHFGDRDLADQLRRHSDDTHQSLQRESARPNKVTPDPNEADDEYEATTTTEDPHRKLRPRVLPPTEQNPGEIDTVTVRVPPIYKERRPKKLHRRRPYENSNEETNYDDRDYERDSEGEDSAHAPQSEEPRRQRRRKLSRKTRATESIEEQEDTFSAGDYDYYGKKLPISDEEKLYRQLRVPEPTKDADLARIEDGSDSGYFLNDHERLSEDPERLGENERTDDHGRSDNSGLVDDSGRSDEKERLVEDPERTDEGQRADSRERTDLLSPNARVRESGYTNNYVRATNLRVDDPRPARTLKST